MSTTEYRTCPLCEATCGVAIEIEGNRVLSVRGDEADPFSRGYICPKAVALADLHHDPDRLTRPIVRSGADWNEVEWDAALLPRADTSHISSSLIRRRGDRSRGRQQK